MLRGEVFFFFAVIFPVYLEKDTQQFLLLQQGLSKEKKKPCGTKLNWVELFQA